MSGDDLRRFPTEHLVVLASALAVSIPIALLLTDLYTTRPGLAGEPQELAGIALHVDGSASTFVDAVYTIDLADPAASSLVVTGYVRNEERPPDVVTTVDLLLLGPLAEARPFCDDPSVSTDLVEYDALTEAQKRTALYAEDPDSQATMGGVGSALPPDRRLSPEQQAARKDFRTAVLPLTDEQRQPLEPAEGEDGEATEISFDTATFECRLDASALMRSSGSRVTVVTPLMRLGRETGVADKGYTGCFVSAIRSNPDYSITFLPNDPAIGQDFGRCSPTTERFFAVSTRRSIQAGEEFFEVTRAREVAIFDNLLVREADERRTFLGGVILGLIASLIASSALSLLSHLADRRHHARSSSSITDDG